MGGAATGLCRPFQSLGQKKEGDRVIYPDNDEERRTAKCVSCGLEYESRDHEAVCHCGWWQPDDQAIGLLPLAEIYRALGAIQRQVPQSRQTASEGEKRGRFDTRTRSLFTDLQAVMGLVREYNREQHHCSLVRATDPIVINEWEQSLYTTVVEHHQVVNHGVQSVFHFVEEVDVEEFADTATGSGATPREAADEAWKALSTRAYPWIGSRDLERDISELSSEFDDAPFGGDESGRLAFFVTVRVG